MARWRSIRPVKTGECLEWKSVVSFAEKKMASRLLGYHRLHTCVECSSCSAANKGESIANLPVNNGVWWERRFYLVPGPPVTSSGLTWTTKSKGWAAVHQPGLQRQELGHRQIGLTRHNTLVISGTASSPPAQAPQHALTSLNSWHCQVSGRS